MSKLLMALLLLGNPKWTKSPDDCSHIEIHIGAITPGALNVNSVYTLSSCCFQGYRQACHLAKGV
ncbi:hypothetical protein [Vibrio sp.]|uniref:hypothetical protein n=1 Tax=Vibrio sp. TaxID=678 RepID=UPI003D0FA080